MDEKRISDIKAEYDGTSEEALDDFIREYISDCRPGVSKLIGIAQKRMENLRIERQRIEALRFFERKYSEYQFICGIDEVGRGPLAGPVVAAAVILPKDCSILYINDSKKLTEKRREELYSKIMDEAVSVGVGSASHERIDEINILNATYEAMREAIGQLAPQPTLLLNDAVTIPQVDIKQVAIVKGDEKSISIGAASIIAKVTRDRMMVELDKTYPGYGFAKNKGYGTAQHIEALKAIGPCEIHRRSFISSLV